MEIFNYNSFDTSLCKESLSLTVTFKSQDNTCKVTRELLFELESLLNWLASRIEISSVLFTSESHSFLTGINIEDWKNNTEQELFDFTSRFTKISQSLSYLPQLIIVDLKEKIVNEGLEFALGADIRVSGLDLNIECDYLSQGRMPGSELLRKGKEVFGEHGLKSLFFAGKSPSLSSLTTSGIISETYTTSFDSTTFLTRISKLSPTARMQTKSAFKVFDVDLQDTQTEKLNSFNKACLSIEDWKQSQENFYSAREIASRVKRNQENKNFA